MRSTLTTGLSVLVIAATTATPAFADSAVEPVQASAGGSLSRVHTNSLLNHNWAGYVQPGTTREVSAQFTVPRTATTPTGFSSTWVGIDGYHTEYLVQTGIGTDVVDGKVTHYAWWEMLTPDRAMPEQRFRLTVRAGDVISARVSVSNGHALVAVLNATRHRSASHSLTYAGPCRSGEWVQEDVNVDGRISPAPNFRTVSFSRITRNRVNPRLTSGQALDIVDGKGFRETRTSNPTAQRNGFSVTWLGAGTWTRLH